MPKEQYIVDRIEGNYVILEDNEGKLFNAEKNYIIGIAKEGDILYKKDSLYYINKEATEKRKEEIDKLMKGLWE